MWHTKKLMLLLVIVIVTIKLSEQAPLHGSKPGKCPAVNTISDKKLVDCNAKNVDLECFLDTNCNGTKKCCRSGCSLICIEPNVDPSVKPTVTSKAPRRNKTPGQCPLPSKEELLRMDMMECPPEPNKCFYNIDCEEGKICCSTGCNLECRKPVSSPTTAAATPFVYKAYDGPTKPGKCPPLSVIQKAIECPPPSVVKHECILDKECSGNKKCCRDACNLKCSQPLPTPTTVKPTAFVEPAVKDDDSPVKPTVKQVPMSKGDADAENARANYPRSCMDYKWAKISRNGYYPLFDANDNSYTAYCDFNSEPKSAWTLVMSWTFLNNNTEAYKHAAFKSSFKKNIPVSQNIPNWNGYRLSKERMRSLKTHSTHCRTTCSFPMHKVDYIDYVRATFNDFNIMKFHGKGICKKVEYVNIGGNAASQVDVLYLQNDDAMFHIRGPSYEKKCEFQARHISMNTKNILGWSVNKEDSVGWYHTANKKFRCTSGATASTQYWFGGYTI